MVPEAAPEPQPEAAPAVEPPGPPTVGSSVLLCAGHPWPGRRGRVVGYFVQIDGSPDQCVASPEQLVVMEEVK